MGLRAAMALFGALVGLVLSEGAIRTVLDPLDFLLPELVPDAVLGHRIAPHSGHHDAWGFRNHGVPERVDIIAIGDSQTYGWASRWSGAWPSILERLSGASVYNMAMGGYGPGQYLALMEHYVPQLEPRVVVIGLFPANDLLGAWAWVYREGRNPELGVSEFEDSTPPRLPDPRAPSTGRPIRGWLSRHSVLYRASMSTIVGRAARSVEHTLATSGESEVTAAIDPERGVRTLLQPRRFSKALDPSDARVSAGFDVTLRALSRIRQLCQQSNTSCVVAIIPSKERVYANVALSQEGVANAGALRDLIHYERTIVTRLGHAMDDLGLPNVDLLPTLRAGLGQGIYPSNRDTHPNERGNELIARAVWEHIKSSELLAPQR